MGSVKPPIAAHSTVHVIDDEASVRDNLGMRLSVHGYNVQTYASARAFLDDAGDHRKGCVIVDVRMPEISGLELLEIFRRRSITLPVVVMTAYADVQIAVRAMKAGAFDFLIKPFETSDLLSAVKSALHHNNDDYKRDVEREIVEQRLATLTGRERDVLSGLLRGLQNKEQARELGIGVRSVESHRAHLMDKMKAKTTSELLRMTLAIPRAAIGPSASGSAGDTLGLNSVATASDETTKFTAE